MLVVKVMHMCVCVCVTGPAADAGGDAVTAASVGYDLYSDSISVADSDVSFATSTKSAASSRFSRSTGWVIQSPVSVNRVGLR